MGTSSELLEIRGLHAGIGDTEILKGIDLKIGPGEIHAIMGRNGSGKTTTANIIMGHPDYEVEKGDVLLDGSSILELESWERARKGVFLSFQYLRFLHEALLSPEVRYLYPYNHHPTLLIVFCAN